MPYQPRQPRRPPTTKRTVRTAFNRADGTRDTQDSVSQRSGSTPQADTEDVVTHEKTELGCGCYWPDAPVAGACPACAGEGKIPDICQAHFVVCKCGTPCCWKHSRVQEDGTTRVCSRCHIRAENKASMAAVVRGAGRLGRFLMVEDRHDSPPPESSS